MKRRFTGVLAALLILVMGTTNVYAASSPTAEQILQETRTLANNVTRVTATSVSGENLLMTKTAATIQDVADAKAFARSKGDGYPNMLAVVELGITTNLDTMKKGVTVRLEIASLSYGKNVYVFHRRTNGQWETLKPSYVGNGYLEVKMYSFSPVAVAEYRDYVSITPDPQDTSWEDAAVAEREAATLAGKITYTSMAASGTITPNKQNAATSDIEYVKIQVNLLKGEILGMANYRPAAALVQGKGVQVTLGVTGLTGVWTDGNVYVLHKRSDGTWETLKPDSISNGYLTIKMYSLTASSTIAVIRVPGILATTDQDTTAEEQEKAAQELQDLAGKIIYVAGSGNVSLTKEAATIPDVVFAKGQVSLQGGTLLGMASLKTSANAATLAKGVQVTLGVSGLKAGDNVYLLQKLSNGNWQTLKPSSVVEGYLSLKMYSLSSLTPVAVVSYPSTVKPPVTVEEDPTIPDPPAEIPPETNAEAKAYADKITFAAAISYTGSVVTLTKGNAAAADVVTAKGLAAAQGGTILGMADLTTTADASLIAKGINVTLYISDVKAGETNLFVLHKLSDGSWETIKPYVVGAGYVAFRMYSLSPIAVVRYPEWANVSTTPQDPGTNDSNANTNPNQNNGQDQGNTQTNNQNQNQSNNQNQTNDNNQSNSQTNNQNNPVNVNQNVSVTYPDMSGLYNDGYGDGFKDGFSAGQKNGGSSSGGNSNSGVKSPKTGAELPALPLLAIFAAAGFAVCKKKIR